MLSGANLQAEGGVLCEDLKLLINIISLPCFDDEWLSYFLKQFIKFTHVEYY